MTANLARLAAEKDHGRHGNRENLARAIDSTVLLPALQAAWQQLSAAGTTIAACAIERVYERADGGFVIGLSAQLEAQGRSYTQPLIAEISAGGARAHFDELIRRFMKQKRRHQLKNPEQPFEFCLVDELGLVVRFAGLDEKVDGLELLHTPGKIGTAFPELLLSDGGNIQARLLAHRLHRRAVIEVKPQDRTPAILKFYKRGSARPAQNASLMQFLERTAFAEPAPVRVPKLIGMMSDYPGFAMTCAAGRPLNELRQAARLDGMALAGEALGRLHRLPLRINVQFAIDDEVRMLEQLVGLTADIFPTLRKNLLAGFDFVSARLLTALKYEPSIVHRDFHERQIIVDGATCTAIDFDTVCNGDPHQDVGNFLAHLDLAGLQGVPDSKEDAAAFLDAYVRAYCKPLADHVTVHRQSTLLRLACIYAFSTLWRKLTPNLIQMVLEG